MVKCEVVEQRAFELPLWDLFVLRLVLTPFLWTSMNEAANAPNTFNPTSGIRDAEFFTRSCERSFVTQSVRHQHHFLDIGAFSGSALKDLCACTRMA
jgi:hypothetical protein